MALASTCLFAAVNDVKPWVKIANAETAHDAILERLANAITEDIEERTGRIFVSRTFTSERSNGTGGRLIVARYYPITAVSILEVDGAEVESNDYTLDAEAGHFWLKNDASVAVGVQNVRLTYTAGWTRSEVPARVIQLALEMIKLRYVEWTSDAIAASSINVGASSMVIKPGWPYHVREAIDALRTEVRGGVAI